MKLFHLLGKDYFGVISKRKYTLFINGTFPNPVAPVSFGPRGECGFVKFGGCGWVTNDRSIQLDDLQRIMAFGEFYILETGYKKSPHGSYSTEYKLSLPHNNHSTIDRVSTLHRLQSTSVLPPFRLSIVINQVAPCNRVFPARVENKNHHS